MYAMRLENILAIRHRGLHQSQGRGCWGQAAWWLRMGYVAFYDGTGLIGYDKNQH
jgi:hypothetical protein